MTGTETIAKRLRCFDFAKTKCKGDIFAFALDEHINCPHSESCSECLNGLAIKLADAIEAEKDQAVSKALIEEAAKQENMDSVLLYNAAKDLQENAHIIKESVLEDLAHCAGLIRKVLKGAKPQLPEGVIWPTYEDGELVKFGDEIDVGGFTETVTLVGFDKTYVRIEAETDDYTSFFELEYGEPVKRPEPEVLDADGVKIEKGDTLYNGNGTAFRVDRLKSLGNTIKLTCIKECAEFSLDPSTLTHQAPVLDADGVPIKVGDTVYHEDEGECVVERIYRQNGDTLLDLDGCGKIWNMANVKPAEVTHRKPDTQEAIESDATMPPRTYYAEHIGHDVGLKDDAECTEAMVLDLLRRQRKLLGGE